MNRRSFLKLLGISAVTTVLPVEYQNTYLEKLLEHETTVSFTSGHMTAIDKTTQLTQLMLSTKHGIKDNVENGVSITNVNGVIKVLSKNRVYTKQQLENDTMLLEQIKDAVTKRYIS